MAEGECKQRDKKNIHFMDKCCSSGGTWQELVQALLPPCSGRVLQERNSLRHQCQTLPWLHGAGPNLALYSNLSFCSDQCSRMGWGLP